ncbi:LysR family transcriptional regulator [Pacificoceanicola onchidii]|uniref:LysR family transcriptional regulator n=1 Tax=Pacificoceanicola onchidii TaxID=2562685 RepID=UPI0010A2F022|nr:LysR family transcriptional regulator [Pacificoceanicola onchidii]
MIDHLRQMAVFARVVDEGSFRAAAREVGLSPSRVSETVSELEDYLGVTLLYRTTRKIALTNEGRIFYGRVVEMLRSAEAGLNEISALSVEPVGALRISIPAFMATGALSTAVAEFARRHPNVALSIRYTDNEVGLIDDGFDLNIRVGWLDDSSMMSRKLAVGQRVLVAGCDYAKARTLPERPLDLEDWDWIRYRNRADTTPLTGPNGIEEKVTGRAQIEVDSVDALYHLACRDMGVTILPSYLGERGIEAGHLVRLLPDWSLRELGIFAVWPDKSRRESLTLLFVRFLADQGLCDDTAEERGAP